MPIARYNLASVRPIHGTAPQVKALTGYPRPHLLDQDHVIFSFDEKVIKRIKGKGDLFLTIQVLQNRYLQIPPAGEMKVL